MADGALHGVEDYVSFCFVLNNSGKKKNLVQTPDELRGKNPMGEKVLST